MSLISGNAIFGGDAVNCSSNSISGLAAFFGTATNAGNVTSAVFNDGAVNCGSITSGVFLGSAINSGSVNVAEFFGTASNAGFVVESAKFADTSSNVGTVSGSAIFTDTSISDGVVEGAVQLGVNVTEGENQALTETPTEYTQTDGFFPNAHYSSGSKTAPTDYETVVHQVGGFWYKYDGNGNGSLASGNYSDGTSMFTFVNGIKGAAYTPSYNVLGSYYYAGTLTSGTTVLYSDSALTTLASSITPFVVAGVARYSTNGSGLVTIESIQAIDSYYYTGTLTSGTTVLYSDNALTTLASSITPFVVAGVARYSTNGSGVVTIENIVSIILNDVTYYHVGTFGNGTELHTTNNLDALAASIGPINIGDISDPADGLNDSVSTNNSGIVTITYGQLAANEIKLPYADANDGASVSYYYAAEDVFETGIVLYTDDALTTTAGSLDLVNELTDKKYTTSNVGVLTIEDISTTSINNTTYYYIGTLTSGVTVLYSDNLLTSTVNDLFYYYNDADENTDKLYTTNNVGVLTIQDGLQVTINSVTYRYVGTLTSGSTILRDSNTYDPVSAFSYADTDNDILYGADSNGVYYEQTILTTTINSITYYYTGTLTSGSTVLYSDNGLNTIATATSYADESADIYYEIDANGVYSSETINTINDASSVTYYHIGTFGVGTILYTNNNFMSPAANLVSCNFGDLSSPPDGFNDLVSTDSSGLVCQIAYGTE